MENLKIVSSFHKASNRNRVIESRELDGFIFREKGYAEYIFPDCVLRVNEGEVIFLPRGSTYRFVTPPQDENLYTSINFTADDIGLERKVYSLSDFYNAKYITQSFTELWDFGDESDRHKCYALFYDLMAHITRTEHLSKAEISRHAVIEPAVEYMKKHIYDKELKIQDLCRLCAISDTYFRKLFCERFNMTPSEYVTTRRLTFAKTIIDNNDYETLKEVAELVGYNDPLYFSKAFKKFYGYSPSQRISI